MKAASILVPQDLYQDITRRADQAGISPQEWIFTTLSECLRLQRETEDFFNRRAAGASSRSFGELLAKVPARPPDPGDEFEL